MNLTQLLLKKKLLTSEHARELEALSLADAELIEEIERRGLLSQTRIAIQVAIAYKTPYFLNLSGLYSSKSRDLLSGRLSRQYHLAPLYSIDRVLTAATLNPFDEDVRQVIASETKFSLDPVVSTLDEIRLVHDAIYHGIEPILNRNSEIETLLKSVRPALPDQPIQMLIASILKQALIKFKATRVKFRFAADSVEVSYVINRLTKTMMTIPMEFSDQLRKTLKATPVDKRKGAAGDAYFLKMESRQIKVRLREEGDTLNVEFTKNWLV